MGKRKQKFETELQCDHNLSSNTSSLIIQKKRFMVFPEKFYTVCRYCGKSFVYPKKEGGTG